MARVLEIRKETGAKGELTLVAEASAALAGASNTEGMSPLSIAITGTFTGTVKVLGSIGGSPLVLLPGMSTTTPAILTYDGVVDAIQVVMASGLTGTPHAYGAGVKGSDS
jgi:hypothetical protein